MKARILLALIMLLTVGTGAQERITLTTPITRPSVPEYRLRALTLYVGDAGTTVDDRVDVDLDPIQATSGSPDDVLPTRRESYGGATANTIILQINKANLTTRSLQQRIFDRLIADGRLAGTVTGTVQ